MPTTRTSASKKRKRDKWHAKAQAKSPTMYFASGESAAVTDSESETAHDEREDRDRNHDTDELYERPRGALPVDDCTLSEADLRERMAQGVPSETPEEYIARVRLEEAGMPLVVAAQARPPEHDPSFPVRKFRAPLQGIRAAPSGLEPTAVWRERALRDFSELRLTLARWRARVFEESWFSLPALESVEMPGDDKYQWEAFSAGVDPLLHVVLQLNDVAQVAAFRRLSSLITGTKSPTDILRQPERRFMWLYAVLAALEQPITVEVSSTLRALLRACAEARAAAVDERPVQDRTVAALNLLICVGSDYFGQGD